MSFKRLRTPLAVLAGSLMVTTVIMGLLHTPAGVHAYQRVTGQACPFAGNMTPKNRDNARAAQARALRGYQKANEKIALGFKFDETTKADIDQWATRVGARCANARSTGELECATNNLENIANIASLPNMEGTLFFDFDAQQKLKRVTAQVSLKDATQATTALDAIAQYIHHRAGGDIIFTGENTPAYLQGMLTQAQTQFHYDDFYAKAQVTHIGSNFVLEQSYESLTF